MEKIFENELIIVSKTDCDCDFIAVIENKTNKDILITFPETDDFFGEEFLIFANCYYEILAIEETPNLMQALEQGDLFVNWAN